MDKSIPRPWHQFETLTSLGILALLLLYAYCLLFIIPYPGFYFSPYDGKVLEIYKDGNPTAGLRKGDMIQSIGATALNDYRTDKKLRLFDDIQAGQTIEIVVQRNGKNVIVPWVYAGFNQPEFLGRFFNIWWLAFVFWFFGLSTQLFVRPRDARRSLMIASDYLIGIFIIFGSVSTWQMWGSAILLRATAWMLLPVYIHFHWIFPSPFKFNPKSGWIVFYMISFGFAAGEFFLPVPRFLYFFALFFALSGSFILLIVHYILQRDHRSEVRLLAIAALLALLPAISISLAGSKGQMPQSGPLSLAALPILPGAYFYVLYWRRLGSLELRTNRAISLYIFLVLLGAVLLLVVRYSGLINISREALLFVTVVTALAASFISALAFPAFQAFVERRILGIKLPSRSLSENYSARIVTSETLTSLLKLLQEEVFPSLLIRQYAFVRNLKTSTQVMASKNVTQDQIQEEALMELLASSSTGSLPPPYSSGHTLDWVRVVLPLQFGSDLIGVWLLGRRDPDDRYSQAELPILQSLANQTAVALSNVIQTERLKSMYEANINRYEQEKLRLAHDLHDSLLNEMAAMLMKHDPSSLPQEFQGSFAGLITRLREIVSDLRPPLLVYGLKYALDGLADNLSDRNQDVVRIVSDIQGDGLWRYPEIVEHNLYRTVQEACENALKYAHAKSINITGDLSSDRIDIKVTDDGVGFNTETSLKLDDMLANKHFGLAGMYERADLIGAVIRIDSKPKQGTQISVLWEE